MIKHEIFSEEKKNMPGTVEEFGRFYRVVHTGTTLDTRIQSLGDGDAYCEAVSWDEAIQRVVRDDVWYNESGGTASIDATPEVWAKVKASVFAKALEWARGVAQNESMNIIKGRVVKVVRGRKFPKGTEATVKFTADGDWGPYARAVFSDGSEGFIPLKNIEILNPDRYMASDAEILAQAEKTWKRFIW
jgi:hypothetical protein